MKPLMVSHHLPRFSIPMENAGVLQAVRIAAHLQPLPALSFCCNPPLTLAGVLIGTQRGRQITLTVPG